MKTTVRTIKENRKSIQDFFRNLNDIDFDVNGKTTDNVYDATIRGEKFRIYFYLLTSEYKVHGEKGSYLERFVFLREGLEIVDSEGKAVHISKSTIEEIHNIIKEKADKWVEGKY